MPKLVKQIPNVLSLLNAVCGSWMIIHLFEGKIAWAFYLGCLALLFDFFDGFAARALDAQSEMGAVLDSIADGLSFGMGSAAIYWHCSMILGSQRGLMYAGSFALIVAALWRLADFTQDEGQKNSFKGLPTPATYIFYLGALLWIENAVLPAWLFSMIAFTMAILMVSHLRLMNFKGGLKTLKDPIKSIFIIVCLLCLLMSPAYGLSACICGYIVFSILSRFIYAISDT